MIRIIFLNPVLNNQHLWVVYYSVLLIFIIYENIDRCFNKWACETSYEDNLRGKVIAFICVKSFSKEYCLSPCPIWSVECLGIKVVQWPCTSFLSQSFSRSQCTFSLLMTVSGSFFNMAQSFLSSLIMMLFTKNRFLSPWYDVECAVL